MNPRLLNSPVLILGASLVLIAAASVALGQTSSFTYQGRLTDGGTAATGNYDFQFGLWDSASGGAQIGSTLTLNSVAVSNGAFNVSLDFGASSFNGANRFLEIGARPSGGGSFITLSPRQQVTATPYAVRSVSAGTADNATAATTATTATNATQLGGVAASQYVQTNDSRLTDTRPPTPGSSNYIQNSTNQQSNTNFNVSGNGTVAGTLSGGIVNATTQFNIAGNRVFGISGSSPFPNSNTFGGVGAGTSLAPDANVNGQLNAFFGLNAGNKTTTGGLNAFFGAAAGQNTTTGFGNSFFGNAVGINNVNGSENAFFGDNTGEGNTQGNFNSFFGNLAGQTNDVGSNNSFFGSAAGRDTRNGNSITLIGASSVAGDSLTNATAIGANAVVLASNSLVLGSINGLGHATADTNVGIGTPLPSKRLDVQKSTAGDGISLSGSGPGYFLNAGNLATEAALGYAGSAGFYSSSALQGDIVLRNLGGRILLQHGAAGAALIVTSTGTVALSNLGSGGSGNPLCRNASNEISNCSSSLRYKSNVAGFAGGLNVINRLRPISFEWKQNHARDIGLAAEEVNQVEPLLTFRNDKGEIEGVKYNQLSAVFINAIKEQQAQIEALRRANLALNARLKNLEQRHSHKVSRSRK